MQLCKLQDGPQEPDDFQNEMNNMKYNLVISCYIQTAHTKCHLSKLHHLTKFLKTFPPNDVHYLPYAAPVCHAGWAART